MTRHARPRCKTINIRTAEQLGRFGIVERLRQCLMALAGAVVHLIDEAASSLS